MNLHLECVRGMFGLNFVWDFVSVLDPSNKGNKSHVHCSPDFPQMKVVFRQFCSLDAPNSRVSPTLSEALQ